MSNQTEAIKIEIKQAYGRRLVYPKCDTSRKLARLAATKTFTDDHLKILRDLGYSFEIQAPKFDL